MKYLGWALLSAAIAYALAFSWVYIIAGSKIVPNPAEIAFAETRGILLWCAAAVPVLLLVNYLFERKSRQGFWYDVLVCVITAVITFNVYFSFESFLGNFLNDEAQNVFQRVMKIILAASLAGITSGFVIGLIYAALNRRR